MGVIWLLPIAELDRVNMEIMAVLIMGVSIWLLHDKKSQTIDYVVYLIVGIVGVTIIVTAVLLDPFYREVFSFEANNRARSGLELLFNVHKDGRNYFVFLGFVLVYVSVAGVLRILLFRLVDAARR